MAKPGKWSTGICECHNCDVCCFACVLPCFVISQNVKLMETNGMGIPIVDDLGFTNKPLAAGLLYAAGVLGSSLAGTASTNPSLGTLGLVECLAVCLHCKIRQSIRKQYNIKPDVCNDCCSDFCCVCACYSCAMAQEQTTLQQNAVTPVIQPLITKNTMNTSGFTTPR